MKSLNNKSPLAVMSFKFRFLPAVLGLGGVLLANSAAGNAFWDPTGTTLSTTANGIWENNVWAPTGTPIASPVAFVDGSFTVFSTTGNGASAVTCTVNANHNFAGIFNGGTGGATTCANLLITGAGILSFTGNQGLSQASGGNTHIAVTLAGTGSIQPGGAGQLYLEGVNTFSGGVNLAATTLVNFNNTGSFGTGNINMNSGGSGDALIPETGPITITNKINVNVAFSCNLVGHAAGITYSGNIVLGANTLTLGCGGGIGNFDTLSGVISGTGGIGRQSSASHGTIIIIGANTYTGKTLLQSSVTSVSSLNSVNTPAQQTSSNLGKPSNAANGTLGIGATTFTGTLLYYGPGETTDRVIDLAGTTGGAILTANGTGPLVFTAINTATGAGAKTLTLQGTNTAANSIGKIVNSGSATAVVKAQAGTWKLTGVNTYTGGTTVNAGTLEISGSVVGNVTNTATGTLTLDTPSTMSSSAILTVSSGGPVNLNFTGNQSVNALIIDGVSQPSGIYGAGTGPLAGTGHISVLGTPIITQQPVSGSVFLGDTTSFAFTVGVADATGLSYQWKQNGNNISGATDSSYAIPSPVAAASAGVYSCWVTNTFGWTNSLDATLFVMGTNAYTQIIRGDNPISYWRLDETNGTLAYDAVGGNLGLYNNVLLNQTGYSLTDSDPGIGLPGAAAGRGYASVTNFTPFGFLGIPFFSLEAWGYFTNLTGVQRIFSTFSLAGGHGWAFGVNGNNGLRFTSGTHQDADVTLGSSLVTGTWYHFMCTCDGSSYYFYLNGNPVGSVAAFTGVDGISQPLTFGCNPVAYTNNNAGDPLGEQVRGRLDELSIYGSQLNDTQVMNHYLARYSGAPLVPAMPAVIPPTNYVSLTTTLQENAAGVGLTYQWFKVPATPIGGATGSSMQLTSLQLSDAGNYYVQITDANSNVTNSPTNFVAVLPIPNNASQLNLTNGLVLHLPFDGDYGDVSGHNNNGTNVGATTFATDGVVGGKALHYSTDTGSSSFNYVTLGVRPDLQFGASTDFTVSYWVRQPASSTFTNLPFFANEPVGSTTGWMFAPYQKDATTAGGWSEAIGSMSSPSAFTSFPDSNLINDGNWHLLVHSAQRTANVITYLDGVQVDSQAIGFLGSISTTTPANIGQDSSGAYAITASADIDDVGVWRRTMTQLEISGMYLAGVSNSVSFALPAPVALHVEQVAGQWQIDWTGGGWTLQASGDVTGSYTNVPNASSPYIIPTPLGPQLFYRLKY